MKILVTRLILQAGIDALRAGGAEVDVFAEDRSPPRDVLLARVADKDGILSVYTERIDEAVMEAAPQLRVISNMAVGYDNVDVAAATRRGIVVTNTPDVLTEATADFTFALLLAVARRLVEADRYVRDGQWKINSPLRFLGAELSGHCIGIVGYGRIGKAVARRAAGFGMEVLWSDLDQGTPLDELLARADFVCLHTPLGLSTRHLIGEAQLARMKAGAFLINTSRGPVVDEQALLKALQKGHLGGAALDVFEREPAVPAELVAMPNVVLAPHISSATVETRTRMATLAAANALAVLQNRRPVYVVNPEVLS